MEAPSEQLFKAALRASKCMNIPPFAGMGVTLEWDMTNKELRGTFKLPLKSEIDLKTGEYKLTAEDCLEQINL